MHCRSQVGLNGVHGWSVHRIIYNNEKVDWTQRKKYVEMSDNLLGEQFQICHKQVVHSAVFPCPKSQAWKCITTYFHDLFINRSVQTHQKEASLIIFSCCHHKSCFKKSSKVIFGEVLKDDINSKLFSGELELITMTDDFFACVNKITSNVKLNLYSLYLKIDLWRSISFIACLWRGSRTVNTKASWQIKVNMS